MLPVSSFETKLPAIEIKQIFDLIKGRTSLGDALMISVANRHLPFVSTMVSWDDIHFENVFPGTVLRPEEYLKGFRGSSSEF